MEIFSLTLNQMIYFFILILVGYCVNKFKIIDGDFDRIISKFLSFVVTPALIIESFYEKFKINVLKENFILLIIAIITVVLLFILANILSKLFTKDLYIRKIYTYSFTNANFGYMGYVLVEALFGANALFKMIVFTIPFNIYAFTIGINSFNPNIQKITVKSMVTPVTISLVIGAVLGLSGIVLPDTVNNAIGSLSDTMGPLAMIMTGFIIAKYNIFEIMKNSGVILASLIRLIVIPLCVVFIMKIFKTDRLTLMVALCTTAMPFGLNGIVFPAAYGQDTKTGAAMALISDILAIITIPVMFGLFI